MLVENIGGLIELAPQLVGFAVVRAQRIAAGMRVDLVAGVDGIHAVHGVGPGDVAFAH